MAVIVVDNLTKDYGQGRGCFGVSFTVKKGEIFGYLGPNGAGKTTTIRHILGFQKPENGKVYVDEKVTSESAHDTNANIGYIPGEISFPKNMTAMEFIKMMADMRGTTNMDKANELINYFELNPSGDMKRMSKGMKQKVAIICAFMHDSKILILDEPTSGLDPLMQDKFIRLIQKEKEAGKTILISSHMFAEVEKTCDRVAIIKSGEIVAQVNINDIKKSKDKVFKVKFTKDKESEKFAKEYEKFDFVQINHDKNSVKVSVHDKDVNEFIRALGAYQIQYISEMKMTLEDYFMKFYSVKNDTKGENEDNAKSDSK